MLMRKKDAPNLTQNGLLHIISELRPKPVRREKSSNRDVPFLVKVSILLLSNILKPLALQMANPFDFEL